MGKERIQMNFQEMGVVVADLRRSTMYLPSFYHAL